ncbi:MAG: hypothetical protein MZV49_03310 [Rhodopseudomonas palustris]|nr:hypothetical protein [Rhodopseudomonas palustris]
MNAGSLRPGLIRRDQRSLRKAGSTRARQCCRWGIDAAALLKGLHGFAHAGLSGATDTR